LGIVRGSTGRKTFFPYLRRDRRSIWRFNGKDLDTLYAGGAGCSRINICLGRPSYETPNFLKH